MSILPQLEKNKGIISSALGKSLARQVLAGETSILEDAVALLVHDDKNVRAGAAKIVEQLALSARSHHSVESAVKTLPGVLTSILPTT